MIVFEELFFQSGGNPVEYKGRIIQMVDVVKLNSSFQKIRLIFEEFGSNWKQGVMLRSKGEFIIDGKRIKNSIILWQVTAPRIVEFGISSNAGEIEVRNVWDTGDGVVHSWHAGAAIYIEETGAGKRYYCNDGHLDDDFNDLIFTIEMI